MDPYSILGVAHGADIRSIKAAYRKIARTYHPDINTHDRFAPMYFGNATAAYEHLVHGTVFKPPYPEHVARSESSAKGKQQRRTQHQPPPSSAPTPPRGNTADEERAAKIKAAKEAHEKARWSAWMSYADTQDTIGQTFESEYKDHEWFMRELHKEHATAAYNASAYVTTRRNLAREEFEREMKRLDEQEATELRRLKTALDADVADAERQRTKAEQEKESLLKMADDWYNSQLARARKDYDETVRYL